LPTVTPKTFGRHETASHRAYADQQAARRIDGRTVRRARSPDAMGYAEFAARYLEFRGSCNTICHSRCFRGCLSCRNGVRHDTASGAILHPSTCRLSRGATIALKSSAEFRAVEKQLLDLLYTSAPPRMRETWREIVKLRRRHRGHVNRQRPPRRQSKTRPGV